MSVADALQLILEFGTFVVTLIPLVSGFHPGIWSFDIAVFATIVWLILRSFYGKENRSH